MIQGTPFGNDRKQHYWVQTNNSIEMIIKAIKNELDGKLKDLGVSEDVLQKAGIHSWLESCGGDAIANAAGSMGRNIDVVTPAGGRFQMDDLVVLTLNDPNNAVLMRRACPWFVPGDYPGNRIMQLHPVAAKIMFGVDSDYVEGLTYDKILETVWRGQAVELHLINPGHYLTAVLTDDGQGIGVKFPPNLLVNDSWPNRKPEWKGDGFNKPLDEAEFKANVHNEFVVYRRG